MNIKNELQSNSPSILLGLGIGGFIGSVILTAKVAPKAKEKLAELPAEAPRMAKVRSVAPLYAPVAGLVLASTGAILASNRIMKNRYAALFVLYSFTEQVAEKWQRAAKEELSAKSFKAVKDKVVGANEDIPEEIYAEAEAKGMTTLWDAYSARWINAKSVEEVRKVINDLNATLYRDGFVELSDFYYFLGMPTGEIGQNLGWHIDDGPIDIDLHPVIKNERPYISISFTVNPKY